MVLDLMHQQVWHGILDKECWAAAKVLSVSLSVAHGVIDQSAWDWLLKVSLRGFRRVCEFNFPLYSPLSKTIATGVYKQRSEAKFLSNSLSNSWELHQIWKFCSEPTYSWFNLNFSIDTSQEEGPIDQIIDSLLRMLEKDVVDNSKSCAEYFEFFRNYSSSVSVQHLNSSSLLW